jgi:CRP-like cAMP-binding protein
MESKTRKVVKGELLLQPGVYCQFGFRVLSGCLKSYILDKKGKEHILQFAPENWVIGDMKSTIEKSPSTIYIEAIENSEVEIISFDELSQMDRLTKEDLIQMNHVLLRNIVATNQRVKNLLSSTSEERYLDFIATYPSIYNRLPLKLIASYLGMTPEYLSDVRKKLTKK